MNYLLITFIVLFALNIIMSYFDLKSKKKREKEMKEAFEKVLTLEATSNKEMNAAHMEHYLRIEKSLKDIGAYLLAEEIMGGPLGMHVPMSPTLRVFALTLRQTGSFDWKTYAVPAMSVAEATDMAMKHLGIGWEVIGSSFIDVNVPLPKDASKPVVLPKEEKGVTDYASYLQYALDNFAKTKGEKDALSEIITRINKKYGRSTN